MGKHDAVIIGSGIGGLLCGVILSREGFNVCIAEKGKKIGGCMQSFTRKGVVFDTGVHYLGSLDEGQVLNTLFRYFGIIGKVPFKRMDERGFDTMTFLSSGREYAHAIGYERFVEELSRVFPSERGNIASYAKQIRAMNDSFPLNNLLVPESGSVDMSVFSTSVSDFLKSITSDEKLRSVLAGTNMLYAGLAEKTPVFIHALVMHSYIMSAYKVVGGSEQIADILADEIRANGGTVMTDAEVVAMTQGADGNLESVTLANGEKIEGTHFIANIHPTAVAEMMDPARIRKTYINRMKSLENTLSVFAVYAAMKEGAIPMMNTNHYCYRTDNVWLADTYDAARWPEGFFLSSTPQTIDDTSSRAITILGYMKYEETEKWEGTRVGRRGDDYEAFKDMKRERMLDLVEQKFPSFSSGIDGVWTSTPLTYRDYTSTARGSMYGIFHDCTDFMKGHVTHRTKIPNLFLAGQNASLHGIFGVAVSSLLTCGSLVGLSPLLEKINHARGE